MTSCWSKGRSKHYPYYLCDKGRACRMTRYALIAALVACLGLGGWGPAVQRDRAQRVQLLQSPRCDQDESQSAKFKPGMF